LLLSFVLVPGLFLLGELPILLAFAYWMFHVPVRGPPWLLVGLSALGSLVFAGMGLLVACRAQNTQTVAGLVNLVSLPIRPPCVHRSVSFQDEFKAFLRRYEIDLRFVPLAARRFRPNGPVEPSPGLRPTGRCPGGTVCRPKRALNGRQNRKAMPQPLAKIYTRLVSQILTFRKSAST
jgi:hypothetical protein